MGKRFFCYVILLEIIVICLFGCAKKNSDVANAFQRRKSDFEKINDTLIQFINDGKIGSYMIVKDKNYQITNLYYNEDIELNDLQKEAINNINDLFSTDFSFIDVYPDRISYGGLGNEMYVYSRNGEIPDYFYSEDDGEKFTTYVLGNDWYLLMRRSL